MGEGSAADALVACVPGHACSLSGSYGQRHGLPRGGCRWPGEGGRVDSRAREEPCRLFVCGQGLAGRVTGGPAGCQTAARTVQYSV